MTGRKVAKISVGDSDVFCRKTSMNKKWRKIMSAIEWITREGYALDSAQTTNKPLLLDMFNPE